MKPIRFRYLVNDIFFNQFWRLGKSLYNHSSRVIALYAFFFYGVYFFIVGLFGCLLGKFFALTFSSYPLFVYFHWSLLLFWYVLHTLVILLDLYIHLKNIQP